MERFPTLESLYHGDMEEILRLWQGMGYYRRAHLLKKGADFVMHHQGGIVPNELSPLLRIPGIGPYTAKAILSIAFEKPYVPVDGNVIRVFSRVFGKTDAYEKLEKSLASHLSAFEEMFAQNPPSPGFFAQSLMDLGRTLCTKATPRCTQCPIQNYCIAFEKNLQSTIPKPKKKVAQPITPLTALLYVQGDFPHHEIFLSQNSTDGLFPGLWGFPLVDGHGELQGHHVGRVQHVLSHKKLVVDIRLMHVIHGTGAHKHFSHKENGEFILFSKLHEKAKSTLMQKILEVYVGSSEKFLRIL